MGWAMELPSPPRFQVQVTDEEYWRRQIKCQFACPVRMDARGYIRAIAAGDYSRAYLIARGPNPLASICGRVCGAPCEAACRLGSIDQPVSIRALKRFVTDQFGGRATPLASFPADECDGLEEAVHLARYLASRDYRQPALGPGERVAIIGSGPAGLAAAHDLALLCLSPVVFEMESKPAGMLYTGIRAYRLPRELIDAEVELIRALGVARSDGLGHHGFDLHAPAGTLLGVSNLIAISGQRTASNPSAIVVETSATA